jgi:hypothetical protein
VRYLWLVRRRSVLPPALGVVVAVSSRLPSPQRLPRTVSMA